MKDKEKPPEPLNKIADLVLNYRPKEKRKKARKRQPPKPKPETVEKL